MIKNIRKELVKIQKTDLKNIFKFFNGIDKFFLLLRIYLFLFIYNLFIVDKNIYIAKYQ